MKAIHNTTRKPLLGRYISLLIALCLALSFGTNRAIAVEKPITSGNYQYTLENGKVTITKYTGKIIDGDVGLIIPDRLDAQTVIAIGSEVFSGQVDLISVTIPESVTDIGDSAFFGCSGLTSITIPDNIISIGSRAFMGCKGLTSVLLSENLERISDFIFQYCSGLTSVTIPASVTEIGEGAFYGCSSLLSIVIPESVTSIGNGAFDGCIDLTISVIEGSAAEQYAIDHEISYTFTIEDSEEDSSIDDPANDLADPSTDQEISSENSSVNNADEPVADNIQWIYETSDSGLMITGFEGEKPSGFLTIPSELDGVPVTSIGKGAFQDCTDLIAVAIPDGVTSIGESAFEGCSNLANLLIPVSVTDVGDRAFSDCPNLTLTIAEGEQEDLESETSSDVPSSEDKTEEETEPETEPETTSSDSIWIYETTDTGVTITGYEAEKLSGVHAIPNELDGHAVTGIGAGVFEGCENLIALDIPDSVISIGHNAFADCPNLTLVVAEKSSAAQFASDYDIPFTIRTEVKANNDEESKTTEDTEGGITWVYEIAGDSAIITGHGTVKPVGILTIPSELEGCPVTGIAENALQGCPDLTELIIPKNVISIGTDAFKDCPKLSLTVTDGSPAIQYAKDFDIPFTIAENEDADAPVKDIIPWTYDKTNDGAIITGFGAEKPSGALIIPSELDGNTVIGIGNGVFWDCADLTEVTIPDSITSIGNYAFHGCTGLTDIAIPDSVTDIGSYAFEFCSGLTTVSIPEGLTVGDDVFFECSNLVDPEQSSEAENSSTSEDSSEDSSQSTDDEANTSGETVEENTTSNIEWTYDTTDDGVILQGVGPEKPGGTLMIPAELDDQPVTGIGNGVFWDCTELTKVIFPETLLSIGDFAFHGCTGLEQITIPESVTSIGNYAFEYCSGLISATVPEHATLGDGVFNECPNLDEGQAGTDDSTSIPPEEEIVDTSPVADVQWKFETTDSGVTITGYEGEKPVGALQIPEELDGHPVTSIGYAAFHGCSGLTSLTIPDSVTSIDYAAFHGCSGLILVKIPNSVTTIGDYGFEYCSGLRSITLPDSVVSIGYAAFHGCNGLARVTLSKSLRSISDYTFYGCTGLAGVTIPSSVTSIGEAAFYECNGLTSVTLPNSVTNIGDHAFFLCKSLTNVEIPSSVVNIGYASFHGCSSLSVVTIPEGVTTIGDYAFYGCTGLYNVNIPFSVSNIGHAAFFECPSLTLIAPQGSYASQYAETNRIQFTYAGN